MTASNLWKVFGSEACFNSIIYEKCKPLSPSQNAPSQPQLSSIHYTMNPMQWGNMYEYLSIRVYESMFSVKVDEVGCIIHPKYNCIGASPDGIVVACEQTTSLTNRYGRMIEVKNIVNRDITGIPKQEYWIQMQIQMETCDLDECDFIETRFKEYSVTEFWEDVENHEHEWKGAIICFSCNCLPKYVYMPVHIKTASNIAAWIESTIHTEQIAGNTVHKIHYWYLDEFSCVLVKRNRIWFQSAVEKIVDTWKIILEERISGYEHRATKKKNMIPPDALLLSINTNINTNTNTNTENEVVTESNIRIVSGVPLKSGICLIKLE